MKKIALALLIFILFPLTTYAANNIKVIVLDANDNPIMGALVKIEYKIISTDAQGVAKFDGVYDLGDVSMEVSKDGYIPYTTVFQAEDNMTITVRLYSSTGGTVRGTVYLNDTEHPADKYIIEVYDSRTNERILTTVTDNLGGFAFAVSIDRKCYIIVRGFPTKFDAVPSTDPSTPPLVIIVNTATPSTPVPSHAIVASDLEFVPGFIVAYGRMAANADLESSYDARKAITAWYSFAPSRFEIFSDSLHHNFTLSYKETKPEVVSGIGYVDTRTDEALDPKKAFLVISVGGPQVNLYTRSLNEGRRVKFVPDNASVDKWHISDTQNNTVFDSSGVGLITFIPASGYLDESVADRIRRGDKRLGSVILAGNAREGTYAAVLKFKEFINGSSEGAIFLENIDKLLLWLYTGENLQIQPMTFVVEYVSPTQARLLGIIVG